MKKRGILLIIAGAMIFSLCACGDPNTNSKNTADSNVDLSKEKKSSEKKKKSTLELKNILDEINTDIKPAITGNDLVSIRVASHLLNWGVGTNMKVEEIKKEVVEWLSDKGNDEQVMFSKKLACVYEAYQKLLGSDAEKLLASAGCDDAEYPWSDSPVETIEAIIEVVQLPEDDTESVNQQSSESSNENKNNTETSEGKTEEDPVSESDEGTYPGADVVEIVNQKGDTTTVYKLVDGRYMDRIERIFVFDGKDTWTDENGVQWNEEVK